MQHLGCDRRWPNLYDTKLVKLLADRMCFLGSDPVGDA